jgi:hypothetical protein
MHCASSNLNTSAPKKVILWGLKPVNSDVYAALGDIGALTPDFGSGYCGIDLLSGIHHEYQRVDQ